MTRFTDASLAAIKPPERGYATYREDGSPLQLRVWTSGVKTFSVIFGNGKRHTIGRYGEVPLAKAREVARRVRAEVTLRQYADKRLDLEDAKGRYMASLDIRPNTRRSYECYLKHLKSTETADILKVLDGLGPSARNNCLLTYKAFFRWCVARDYLERSPVEKLATKGVPSRGRLLTDEEIAKIWRVCERNAVACMGGSPVQFQTEECEHRRLPTTYATIIQLLILTGCRRNEIASLQKSWIRENTIIFPKEITKNKRAHSIPLCASLTTLLEKHGKSQKLDTSAYLFQSKLDANKPFSDWHHNKKRLDDLCGFDDWVLHDLRRYFRSTLAKLGVRREIAEMLVNHVRGSRTDIELIYDRYDYAAEKAQAAKAFADHIRSITRTKIS